MLLILSGAAISIAVTSGGLFERSKQTATNWNAAVQNDQATVDTSMAMLDNALNPGKSEMKLLVNSGSDGYVVLPLQAAPGAVVDWGDGTTTATNEKNSYRVASAGGLRISPNLPLSYSHNYSETNKDFIISITGITEFKPDYNIDTDTREKIKQVIQWGEMELELVYLVDCENLTSIASPTAHSFKNSADFDMSFSGCTALTEIPEDLFKYNTNMIEFLDNFSYCVNLERIPNDLFRYNTNAELFHNTFEGCLSLEEIPEDLFKYNTNVEDFVAVFMQCESLEEIPEDLFRYNTNAEYFDDIFYACQGLTEIPDNLFKYNTNARSFADTFGWCTSLTQIPSTLFSNNINVENFSGTFTVCDGLTSIPAGLFNNCNKVIYFSYCFSECSNLATYVPLWERIENSPSYEPVFDTDPNGCGCFYGCPIIASHVPEYWKQEPDDIK